MNPRQFLVVLRERWKTASLVVVFTIVSGTIGNQLLPKRYTADASVIVDIRSPDPLAALLSPTGISLGSMGTQVDIIRSDRVARKVVKILRLDESPATREMWLSATEGNGKFEDWMSMRLRKGLTVTPSRDSNIVTIAYQGSDPVLVKDIANAFAQAYVDSSVELKVEPAKQYAQWFAEQAKALRENVEKAQGRLSEFQQRKGIVATDDAMDSEHAKLRDLASRLTAVQGETRDALSKQRSGPGAADTLPEVMGNSVVAGLRSNIAMLEAKLKEAAGNLGVNHPQYLRMESELAELKNRLAAETSHVASGYSSSGAVGRVREAELRSAIDAQTKKVLQLKTERDEISVLVREVDTAKRAYEAVTNRLNQTHLESQATRTNVSVLTPAVEPLEPSLPRPLGQVLLLSVILGMGLAAVSVVGLEMLDKRIRSANDLAEMLQLPVLAVIERGGRARPRALQMSTPALRVK